MAHKTYIALGSNLGDRLQNLKRAVEILQDKVRTLRESPVYETAPWGLLDQPAFLNQVIEAETDLAPHQLLARLKQVEREMGRVETVRYGPRIIDLDILFYNDEVIDLPSLVIPHPRIRERAFVLVPLADLAPDKLDPLSGKSVREMLQEVDVGGVKKL